MDSHLLITLATVKAWLGITTTESDAVLNAAIARASRMIERELHWYFGPARERADVMCGTGTRKMFLEGPFLDTDDPFADTFTLECRTNVGEAWEAVAATDYEQRDRRLVRADGYRWTKGLDNFRATYNEGYESVPGDVQQLALDMVSGVWRQQGNEGVQSERIGDYAYTLKDLHSQPMWPSVRDTYRRKRIGGC